MMISHVPKPTFPVRSFVLTGKCFDEKTMCSVVPTPHAWLDFSTLFLKNFITHICWMVFASLHESQVASSTFLIRLSCIKIYFKISLIASKILECRLHLLSSRRQWCRLINSHPTKTGFSFGKIFFSEKIYGNINNWERPPTPTQSCGQKWGLV